MKIYTKFQQLKGVVKPLPTFVPSRDGIDHINIFSRGKTELGRLLSHFADMPVHIYMIGEVRTIEGYIYWLQTTHPEKEFLLNAGGLAAKTRGREWRATHPSKISADKLMELTRKANLAKASRYPEIQKMLVESTLPLTHYYEFNGVKRPAPKEWDWIVQFWTDLRKSLKMKFASPYRVGDNFWEYKRR